MSKQHCDFKVDPASRELKRQSGQGLELGVKFKISQKKNGHKTLTNFSLILFCNHKTQNPTWGLILKPACGGTLTLLLGGFTIQFSLFALQRVIRTGC